MNTPSLLLPDHAARLERARLSLDGLSIGDAFGQHFFVNFAEYLIAERRIPYPRWKYTDDTEMALAIFEVLMEQGRIDQDRLAAFFASRFARDPSRGYGATAHTILTQINQGTPWRTASYAAFDGEGSMGNGAAMRVAPLGAYFADDYDRVAAEAKLSAEVTHGHAEGQAGGVAIAVAAAYAWRVGNGLETHRPGRLIKTALRFTPESETRRGIEQALEMPRVVTPPTAADFLGSGQRVIAQDTVPFSLWCAERHLDQFEEAMWHTVMGLGDRDTTCAIVGGIVALAVGRAALPADWLYAREPLHFED
ncbi:MAG: ADP-ribosylglycohydrolase family protein [Planctomycetia bacterium]|nr:ADP-ribosylglycohydrolase family protein [Planctomycetia bacterium]